MAITPRVPRFTPEQSTAWQARKLAQWERIRDAFAAPAENAAQAFDVSMIQTSDTFMVYARGDEFADEFCLGSPAHNVTRDDKLLAVPARDPSDAAVNAVITAWKSRRKVTNFDPLHGKGEPPGQR